jgi:hypothetical protein
MVGMASPKLKWRIRGYDKQKQIFEKTVSLRAFTENQMIAVLQRLVCKHLDHDDIVAASRQRSSNSVTKHLQVTKQSSSSVHPVITVGRNPYFIAVILTAEDMQAKPNIRRGH